MDLLILKKKLKELSFDDFESSLYQISDEQGFLSPDQMLIMGVKVHVHLFVSDFLDLFIYSRLKL
jgi:predicted metalloprotease with PDZ domain